MTTRNVSKQMNITLWTAQIVLSVAMVFGGAMKLFQPIDSLAAMWRWTGEVSPALVRTTGIIDLIGAVGLVLPAVIRSRVGLGVIAAMSIVLLMLIASLFHISRGEGSQIGVTWLLD